MEHQMPILTLALITPLKVWNMEICSFIIIKCSNWDNWQSCRVSWWRSAGQNSKDSLHSATERSIKQSWIFIRRPKATCWCTQRKTTTWIWMNPDRVRTKLSCSQMHRISLTVTSSTFILKWLETKNSNMQTFKKSQGSSLNRLSPVPHLSTAQRNDPLSKWQLFPNTKTRIWMVTSILLCNCNRQKKRIEMTSRLDQLRWEELVKEKMPIQMLRNQV